MKTNMEFITFLTTATVIYLLTLLMDIFYSSFYSFQHANLLTDVQ